MATKQEVENFLIEFKEKMQIWDVLFRADRDSNIQTLADLDIRPIEEKLHGGSNMWVFGKDIKKQEVYIKITMGSSNQPVICISFHRAKFKMNFPLKTR